MSKDLGKKNSLVDSSDDDDLECFQKLEAVLNEEAQEYDELYNSKIHLAEEFPTVFIDKKENGIESDSVAPNQVTKFKEIYANLIEQTKFINSQRDLLEHEKKKIQEEKKMISQERAQVETDKLVAESKLDNIALIQIRNDYDNLKKKYETEKQEWENEKIRLLDRIHQLENDLSKTNEEDIKSSKTNNNYAENQKIGMNSDSKLITKTNSTKKVKDISQLNGSLQKESQKISKKTMPNPKHMSNMMKINEEKPEISSEERSIESLAVEKKKTKNKKYTYHHFPEEKLFDTKYKLDFDFSPNEILHEEIKNDGRHIIKFRDGTKGIQFKNGTIKYQRENCSIIHYDNNDVSIEYNDGTQAYRYAITMAIEITNTDKSILYIFQNGQKEIHYLNGDKAILFPNHEYKIVYSNGDFEIKYPTGRVEKKIQGKIICSQPENF